MTKIVLRILKYFLLVVAILLFLVIIAINLPFVQSFLTKKGNSILAEKEIPVRIGKFSFLINGNISIEELEMIPSENDTIVYVKNVRADIDLISLLSKQILVNKVRLNDAVVNLIHNPETDQLNLISAFTNNSNSKKEINKDENKPDSWDIKAKRASLKNVRFKYSDPASGVLVKQSLAEGNISIDEMSLKNQNIDIESIELIKPIGFVGVWEGTNSNADDETTTKTNWKFSAKDINFEALYFELDLPDDGQKMNVSLVEGEISKAHVSLFNNEIGVKEIELNAPEVTFLKDSLIVINSKTLETGNPESISIPMLDWTIVSEKITIDNGFLNSVDKTQSPEQKNPYLPLQKFNTTIKDAKITPEAYNITLDKITLEFSDMIKINRGELSFNYNSNHNYSLNSDIESVLLNEREQKISLITKITGDWKKLQIITILPQYHKTRCDQHTYIDKWMNKYIIVVY